MQILSVVDEEMSRFYKGAAAMATTLLAIALVWWRHSTVVFEPFTVRGQRVLVTGATFGIGEAIAHQYARLGARLVLTAVHEGALHDVAATCSRLGAAQAHPVVADLFHRKSRQEVVDAAHRMLGGLDVLVVAHGHFGDAGWWLGNGDNMTSLFEDLNLNFFGYADLVSRSLATLEASGGAVAVASTVSSHIGLPWRSTASASRFATRGFFKALGVELRRRASAVSVTLAYLRMPGKEQEMHDGTGSGATQEEAMAFVEAVSLRKSEVYFPALGAVAVFLNAAFPDMVENRILNFVAK